MEIALIKAGGGPPFPQARGFLSSGSEKAGTEMSSDREKHPLETMSQESLDELGLFQEQVAAWVVILKGQEAEAQFEQQLLGSKVPSNGSVAGNASSEEEHPF